MELYTIKSGKMKQVPVDYELKQAIKYIIVFVLGLILGNFWRLS